MLGGRMHAHGKGKPLALMQTAFAMLSTAQGPAHPVVHLYPRTFTFICEHSPQPASHPFPLLLGYSCAPHSSTMLIATPPPNSGLPTLVAQQLEDGTVLVQEIPVITA